jgi:hypothetical protein
MFLLFIVVIDGPLLVPANQVPARRSAAPRMGPALRSSYERAKVEAEKIQKFWA